MQGTSEESTFMVICAWCTGTMRQGTSEQISHGICFRCRRSVLRKLGVMARFVDGSPAGMLGQIADRGFEILRRRDEILWLNFAAIRQLDDEAVTFWCDEETLSEYLA